MPVFYSFISRGNVVVCDHSTAGVNLELVALQALDNLGPNDVKRCQVDGNYKVFTMVESGLTYLCITDYNYRQDAAYELLSQIKTELRSAGLHKRALSCRPYALRGDFSAKLGTLTSYACEDGVAKMQQTINNVSAVMTENIEKVIQRGEAIDDIEGRAESLAGQSLVFRQNATKLKRSIMLKSVKLWIVVAVIILVILAVIATLVALAATHKL